jgi:hypothetical protein
VEIYGKLQVPANLFNLRVTSLLQAQDRKFGGAKIWSEFGDEERDPIPARNRTPVIHLILILHKPPHNLLILGSGEDLPKESSYLQGMKPQDIFISSHSFFSSGP